MLFLHTRSCPFVEASFQVQDETETSGALFEPSAVTGLHRQAHVILTSPQTQTRLPTPAMPRYRLPPPSDNGWTSVPTAAHKRQHTPRRLNSPSTPTAHDDYPPPDVERLIRSINETTARISAFAALQPVVQLPPMRTLELHGLGSLHGPNEQSAVWQLALALALGPKTLRVFDPVFTEHDVTMLEKLGCAVNPTATSTSSTADTAVESVALFAPHLEYDVLAPLLRRGGWDWVCCNDLREFVDMRVGQKEESSVFKTFLEEGWKEKVLADCEEAAGGRAFNHLAVYWKEGAEVREDGKEEKDDLTEALENLNLEGQGEANETGGQGDKVQGDRTKDKTNDEA